MEPSVITLPESDDKTLCLAFTGIVTKDDHYNHLVRPMQDAIARHGYFNLVLWYKDDFKGLSPAAAGQSFISIADLGKYAHRLAYVNPTARKLFQNTLMRGQMGQATRNFNESELAEAIAWAKQG